jgi:type 2 lantibiotic biosynthesis protein LanM
MGKNMSHISSASPIWQSSGWYRAATLSERVALLHTGAHHPASSSQEAREKALRRLQRWKEQAPFDQETFFTDRLELDGLNEQELLALLAASVQPEQAKQPAPPPWLVWLQQAFAEFETLRGQPLPPLSAGISSASTDFLFVIKPLLQYGLHQFESGVQSLVKRFSYLPFAPQTINGVLFGNLAQQLLPQLSRTIVLELNVARLQGHLTGETAEERFASYLQRLAQPEYLLALLEEYSVLARQLVVTIQLWVAFSLEFLEHLCTDWQTLCTVFLPEGDPGLLLEATAGAGDTHRSGRSVMLLTFASGWRLVYKPKSLAIDVHFQELLLWLNAHDQLLDLRTLALLDRGTYGWSEFIAAASCQSEQEVARFYERQGTYLALLYALDAVDFHRENVIAAGEYPMLIDLEALFHPRPPLDLSEQPALNALDHSVLSIGLLPVQIWSNNDTESIDISGLGGQEGQLIPQPMPRWSGAGTDQMRLVQERIGLSSQLNRPRLNNCEVQTLDYSEHIIAGFTHMYRFLTTHRDEFLTELLPRFAHDEIRYIGRATRTYGLLLFECFHPNVLRDALQRERRLDRLWSGVQRRAYLSRLIGAERADLLQGDIPVFTTHPDAHHLYTSRNEPVLDFFPSSSLGVVCQRILQLDEGDLSWQTSIIRSSFASMVSDMKPTGKEILLLQPSHTPVTRERLVAGAMAVGDRLCHLAIHGEEATGWLSIVKSGTQQGAWKLQPADIGLYAGNSGIALFLAYLGYITGEARYTVLARKAIKTIRHEVMQIKKLPGSIEIGAFMGLGGPIYLYAHLGVLWNDTTLLQEALELVKLLPDLLKKDDRLDVVAGAAGCIASLLSLYAVVPSSSILAVAIQCGEHLLAQACSMNEGIGWRTHAYSRYPPTPGFAHGAAGIAWSLLTLARVSGQERFRQAALEALTYERSLFSPEKQAWLMPQKDEESAPVEAAQSIAVSWNQGAPGIALSRLASLRSITEPLIRDEIDVALERTIVDGFARAGSQPNHSLSHGYFGNLDILLVAAQTLGEAQYHESLKHFTAILLDSIDTYGWITSLPMNVEMPGLMTGLAGIGYELLRLAEPERVPSILLLAPPCAELAQMILVNSSASALV